MCSDVSGWCYTAQLENCYFLNGAEWDLVVAPDFEQGEIPPPSFGPPPKKPKAELPPPFSDIAMLKPAKANWTMALRSVSGTFWFRVRDALDGLNQTHRDELRKVNLQEGCVAKKSLRKRLSWFGGVRVPKEFKDDWPASEVAWR